MKLNVLERVMVLSVLPKENNFLTLKVIQEIQNKVGLSSEDYKKFDIVQGDGELKWNQSGNEGVDIYLGEKAMEIIRTRLEELDKQKKLTPNHMSVYEKFVHGKTDEDTG